MIDDATYAAAVATPIQITKPPGLRRAPYFTDYVTAFVNRIPGFNGHLEGLKVYTHARHRTSEPTPSTR